MLGGKHARAIRRESVQAEGPGVATSKAAHERLSMKTKLAFGVGSGAEAIALYSVSSFGLLFYNQLLGVPAHLAGLAISASLFLDGISDPLVGSISDRTKSRWGRRQPSRSS